MGRLMKSFFYKVSKDAAFRVALIIGCAFAVILALLFLAIDLVLNTFADGTDLSFKVLSGQTMLTMSMLPAQDFALVIPIIIVCFIGLEFSQGTIRNKIIAGYSKFEIYSSLYLSGLLLYFMLIVPHILICVGIGSIFGGFDPNGSVLGIGTNLTGTVSPLFILQYVILGLLSYTSIVSFVVFFVTLFRSIGPCIPITIIILLGCYFVTTIMNTVISTTESMLTVAQVSGDQASIAEAEKSLETVKTISNVLKVIDPLASMSMPTDVDGVSAYDTYSFFAGVGSNLAYAAAFFFGGAAIFKKRDIK